MDVILNLLAQIEVVMPQDGLFQGIYGLLIWASLVPMVLGFFLWRSVR